MESYLRFHAKDLVNARIIASGDGSYTVTISEAQGKNRIPTTQECNSSAEAKQRADAVVQKAYPHDCAESKCSDWKEFGAGAPIG
jgi:hypothetical protein